MNQRQQALQARLKRTLEAAAERDRRYAEDKATPQSEFEKARADYDRDYVEVQVALDPMERANAPFGVTHRSESVPRAQWEQQNGIPQIRAAQAAYTKTLSTLWKLPLSELYRHDAETLYDMESGLSLADEPVQDYKRIDDAFEVWQDGLQSRQAILSHAGLAKLKYYCAKQFEHEPRTVFTNSAAWDTAVNRLRALGALGPDDYAAVDAEVVVEPVLSDKERMGQDWLRHVLFPQWEAQILRDYGIVLSDTQRRLVCDMFMALNLSPLNHESYNEIRRRMVKSGQFPKPTNEIPFALTVDERFADMVEDYDLSSPEGRRAYAQEMGRIRATMPLVQGE